MYLSGESSINPMLALRIVRANGWWDDFWADRRAQDDDGRLDIDNNLCEQQIRALALGRKNYLFAGSHDAARRLAIGYTITRTCAMHGVLPQPYVTDVLEKLAAGWPQSRIDELLPDRWQELHAAG